MPRRGAKATREAPTALQYPTKRVEVICAISTSLLGTQAGIFGTRILRVVRIVSFHAHFLRPRFVPFGFPSQNGGAAKGRRGADGTGSIRRQEMCEGPFSPGTAPVSSKVEPRPTGSPSSLFQLNNALVKPYRSLSAHGTTRGQRQAFSTPRRKNSKLPSVQANTEVDKS